MGSVRFHAWRLDPRWLLLAGVLIAAVIVTMLSLRGTDRSHPAPMTQPAPPTIGVGIPPMEPDSIMSLPRVSVVTEGNMHTDGHLY